MKYNFSTGDSSNSSKNDKLKADILGILEKELFAFNEGCVGTGCKFTVIGKEKAAKAIAELVEKQPL